MMGCFHGVFVLLVLAVHLVSAALSNQQPILSKISFDSHEFDEAIELFIQDRNITGLSVALTYHDRLIYAAGFGYADQEAKVNVSIHDRFRLASVSKSITAVAAMKLVESGMLRLDDYVLGNGSILGDKYSSKTYSEWERNITVQHLLEHSLGFVNEDMCGYDCDPTIMEKFLALDQWQLVGALLDQYTPSHAPGTYANYSNFGFFLAGRVIEAASGIFPYQTYVQEAVLSPLGIVNMTLAVNERQEHEVKYYDVEEPEHPYNFHIHRRDSVGAWIATPIDLTRLLTAINGLSGRPDFLNQSSIDTLFEKSPIASSSYAKGFTVRSDEHGLIDAAKDGGYWGTRSFVNINFRNKTTYAIVVNSEMPKNERFNDGHDLKTLMDNLTWPIEQWPYYDLFSEYGD
jgi:CubicO group peptidase (beta-lactamase class C family)